MISFVVFSTLLISAQAIIDTNCTDGTNPDATALNCEDVYSSSACEAIYSPAVALADTERPDACFASASPATEIDTEVRDIAIASCPKTCGYCCLTKEWNCQNANLPRITCSSITKAMCKDPTWREIIAEDCPASCGFCTLGGCVDAAPDCHLNPTVCFINGLEEFASTNCKRTCGLCSSSTTGSSSGSSTTGSTTCTDAATNCRSWSRNGFCTSTFYSTAEKRRNCASTCGLC